MDKRTSSEITKILQDWNNGREEAKEQLLPFVYEELKRQARRMMSRERVNHTLQPTVLVHEVLLMLLPEIGYRFAPGPVIVKLPLPIIVI